MIDEQVLRNYARKMETDFRNVLREYFQNLYLSAFYKKSPSNRFFFKGGTALRIVFNSPRFSEDLDFSSQSNSSDFEKLLESVLTELLFENAEVNLIESKPTSGGHLAIIEINSFGQKFEISQQVSFRPKSMKGQLTTITPQDVPSYNLYYLQKEIMLNEKLEALLTRHKSRDIFDLYFILRKEELRQALKINNEHRIKILSLLDKQDRKKIASDLKSLLPKSFWPIVIDLPAQLRRLL